MFADLRDLLAELRHDDAVRVLIVTGAGRGFCSGGDVNLTIGHLLGVGVKERMDFTRTTGAVVRNMRHLDKPIIAAVNGVAGGAGSVIALASDIRIAGPESRFAFMFTKVGLSGAEMGAAHLLPKVVGMGRATEILLFGRTIDAEEAERIGLVNRVVPQDQVLDTAREWATKLAAGPTMGLRMTKRRLVNEASMDLVSALESEAEAQALLMMSEDHRAYYEAFTSKTEPRFKGR
jgi:enoyl-CoA hydratase/carnithine racemase